MRILISGTGRSGTCLLVEVVRGLDFIRFSEEVEDREFFEYKNLPDNYGTKLTTEHSTFSMKNIISFMGKYKNLYLLFSARHPIDIFMSKIRRGQKASDGGDRQGEWIADDSTVEAAIWTIKDFYKKYNRVMTDYPERTMLFKLENLISYSNETIKKIADYFNVKVTKKSQEFYKHDRNNYHKKRYKGRIDKSQIAMYKRWDTVYNGFFKNRENDIEYAKKELGYIIDDLSYEI